jgi:hypothetical protein
MLGDLVPAEYSHNPWSGVVVHNLLVAFCFFRHAMLLAA